MKKAQGGERWTLLATIESGSVTNLSATLACPGWDQTVQQALGNLGRGSHQVLLDMPAVPAEQRVTIRLAAAADEKEFTQTVKPPKHWTVYLVQHTHTDIGYTRPQTEILPEHLRYIDWALDFCDLTDKYPEEARFRWTCETSWAVREYLDRRPPEQIARLKRRVKEGRIEVAAMLLNMSEIATESSLAASLQTVRRLQDELGGAVRTAMQNDVNGAGWCLVDYFSDSGIKYLTMGINKTRSLLPFDKPTAFWWESPSGKRILANRPDHYMTANFWHIHEGKADRIRPEMVKYLQSLEARNYPFDRISVQFSGYFTDNSPPSTAASEVVKDWNATYAWPKLQIANASDFLNYVSEKHAKELPVFRAAWPDWWTDGFGSAARETAASREMHTHLQATEGLFTMAALLGSPIRPQVRQRIATIQEDLVFYDEHTYGAAESISDPLAENTQVQWAEKSAYVWSAVKSANLLREEALGLLQDHLPRATAPTVVVFNTLNWDRAGLVQVFIDHELLPRDQEFRIVDIENGETITAQPLSSRSEGTYWALWAKTIPAFGYRGFRIEVAPEKRPALPRIDRTNTFENTYYQLTLDPTNGAVRSLIDKESGKELVDQESPWNLGQLVYESLAGGRELNRQAFTRTSLRNVKITPGTRGPIWHSLLVSGDLDGCAPKNGAKAEIRLFQPEKRIEFHFAIRKLPVSTGESVYVTFPFQAPGAKMLYEAQGGLVTPGESQIPGSSSDWQTVQNFLAIRDGQSQVIWGTDQIPLVQLGDFNLGKWQPITKVERNHIYSWVMNNYWFTNFRLTQEGEFKWQYYLTSTADRSNAAATRFGWNSRLPLLARVFLPAKTATGARPGSVSIMRLHAPNLVIVEARTAADGEGIVVHLREVEGKALTLTPSDLESVRELARADVVNVLEQPIAESVREVTVQPYEAKFVRLMFK